MIKKLMAKDLIKVCGKSDLPEIKFNKENSNEEVDLYKSTYKEN